MTYLLAAAGLILSPLAPPSAPGVAAASADTGRAVRLVVAPTDNVARYRVREQLVGIDFPNDAVGATSAITGALALDQNGRVVPDASRFVIDVTGLKSDKERRDGYLQRRTLETAQFPTVTLVPTALRDLPWPLPAAGTFTFTMVADLTIKAVTKSVEWRVEAQAVEDGFTGTATTTFPFEVFELTKPRVSVVLSVENEITLEYDFLLIPDTTTSR